MRKLISIFALSSTLVVAAVVATHSHWPSVHAVESLLDSVDDDAGPPDGDYWAVRAGVTSTNGTIDPLGIVKAAAQDRAMATGVPAGTKSYTPQIARALNSPLTLDPNHFVNLGPEPENNTQQSFNHVSGRVNWIAVDPQQTQPNNIVAYLATDGGGVWKTTNCCSANTTWAVKTDFPELASMSIDDITIDPNDHNIVYAATGDLNYGSFSFGAAGVLKSVDQGETWDLLGADVFTPYYAPSAGSFPQYQAVGKIRIDPNDSNKLIAGTKTGLYFSYNGGTTWTGPCYTNPYSAGVAPQRQDITGLLPIDNGDGTTRLYAVVGTRGIATPVQPDLGNQGANGVYRVPSMPASGCPAVAAWTLLNSGWPANTGNGVANATGLGRIEIAYAPSNPQRMYAEAQDTTTRAVNSVYRTDDGGDHWTMTTGPVTTMGCEGNSNNGGAQMWYDAGLTVDPNNPDRLFMSTIDLTVSQNGAASFFDVTCGYGNHATTGNQGQAMHVDNHARAYVGNDSTQLLVGSDGGVYYTNNADASVTASNVKNQMNFIAMNDSISSIEFYFGDITSGFATAAAPAIGAGAQDNGCSHANFSGTPTGPALWNSNCSGDGTMTKIEPVFNQIWFNSSQNGALARNTTGGTGTFSTASANTGGTWGGDPVASIFGMSYDIYKWGDVNTPNSGCDSVNGCNHMIAGTTRLWETTQATVATTATLRTSWKARTLNLTKNDLLFPANGDLRSYINYVAYSFTDPSVAIVATNDGNVQMVFGLGTAAAANCVSVGDGNCATAVDVTGGNAVLPNRPIQGVRFDPTTTNIAYAAVGGFNGNVASQNIPPAPGSPPAIPGHVFQITCTAPLCATFTWADKTGNLPDIPAQQVMPNPNLAQQVFVGTDWGLYYTDDITQASPVWYRFEGLPHVMVWELVVDRGFTTMAAFTRARGAFVWPLPASQLGVADLAIAQAGPSTAIAGNTVTYTITVSNNDPATASNVIVNDPTPAGLTFVSNSGDCVTAYPCTFASLNVGETKTITTTFAIAPDYSGLNPYSNVATVSSPGDINLANNTATVMTSVTVAADVGVTQTAPSNVAIGGNATFAITVTNHGPSTATNVVLSETPTGMTFVSNAGDCTNSFPCTFATIAPNASVTVNATFHVPIGTADGANLSSSVSISSDSNDGNSANDTDTTSTTVGVSADITVVVSVPTPVEPGLPFVITTSVTNNGPSVATDVSASVSIPTGMGFVGNEVDCTGAFPCTFATIDVGVTKTIQTTVCVPSNYAGADPFAISAAVSSTSADPNTSNNSTILNSMIDADALFINGFESCP